MDQSNTPCMYIIMPYIINIMRFASSSAWQNMVTRQPLINLIEDRTHKLLQLVIYRIPHHLAHRFLGVSAVISTHTMLVFCYSLTDLGRKLSSMRIRIHGLILTDPIQFSILCDKSSLLLFYSTTSLIITLDNITRW